MSKMTVYKYKARNKRGKLVKGLMEAESKAALAEKLKRIDYLPVSIARAKIPFIRKLSFSKIRLSELNMWSRQFAALQKAGVPILLSFKSMEEEVGSAKLREITKKIRVDIESGESLSLALEKHSQAFDPLYVNMIKIGEANGTLARSFDKLAELGEYQYRIRQEIKSALRYPLMVLGAMFIGFLVVVAWVMPRFSQIYRQLEGSLPLPTQILLAINHVVINFWWLLLLVVCICIFIFNIFRQNKKGKFFLDKTKLKIPIFGKIILKLNISRFAHITGTLMASGVPLQRVLALASEGVDNSMIVKVIENLKKSVNEGRGLAEPMRASNLFPSVVLQMVSVGERGGKLDELLLFVSGYYDLQIKRTIENLTSLIEPLLVFILGLGVLFMALGAFLPLWDLVRVFRGGG